MDRWLHAIFRLDPSLETVADVDAKYGRRVEEYYGATLSLGTLAPRKRLRDRSPVPIAAGEGECGRESFRPLIDQHALDVYQVDLSRNGFTDASYIRQRVEEIGARLCNHCYTSPLTVAASLHWLSTCRDAFIFEDCVEDVPMRNDLTLERVQADKDGLIRVPDRPGLGITLNEEFVKRYLIAESR